MLPVVGSRLVTGCSQHPSQADSSADNHIGSLGSQLLTDRVKQPSPRTPVTIAWKLDNTCTDCIAPPRCLFQGQAFQDGAHDTHSKTIGYLLWIFGFTGAHRFYYGKPITGVLWFLTLGLAGIGWLIDLFLIPGMDRRADLRFTAGRYDYSVAWLLQTFLGLLGIHRLYLGKIWTGILWMLTAGLFGVGWIYDFCTLNSQVDERNRA